MAKAGHVRFTYGEAPSLDELRRASLARKVEHGDVPDMSGMVQTVRGAVPLADLGVTLPHEHLFLDLRENHLPHPVRVEVEGRSEPALTTEDFPATELALWEAKVGLGNLHIAREGGPIADNYVLSDEKMATREALEFKQRGGGALVEVTSIGFKRDPRALRRLSEATGLHVVMGTGHYQSVFHPADMDHRSVEELTDEIVTDVVAGVGDTGVRSGIIGEVGVNGDPLRPNEIKAVRAAARASRLTGAAISIHRGGAASERRETLNVAGKEGADLGRLVLGHSDEIAADIDLMLELLERGVYIEFDLLGREETLVESTTSMVARAVPELVAAGFEDRILLSQDICWKVHLKHYGGSGYSFILEKFLPHLLENGVSRAQTDKFTIENPARVLAFVAPQRP
jgi:phosphotriesterase-related protein